MVSPDGARCAPPAASLITPTPPLPRAPEAHRHADRRRAAAGTPTPVEDAALIDSIALGTSRSCQTDRLGLHGRLPARRAPACSTARRATTHWAVRSRARSAHTPRRGRPGPDLRARRLDLDLGRRHRRHGPRAGARRGGPRPRAALLDRPPPRPVPAPPRQPVAVQRHARRPAARARAAARDPARRARGRRRRALGRGDGRARPHEPAPLRPRVPRARPASRPLATSSACAWRPPAGAWRTPPSRRRGRRRLRLRHRRDDAPRRSCARSRVGPAEYRRRFHAARRASRTTPTPTKGDSHDEHRHRPLRPLHGPRRHRALRGAQPPARRERRVRRRRGRARAHRQRHAHAARPSTRSPSCPTPTSCSCPAAPARSPQRAGGAMLDWLRSADRTSTWTTSVCTGSLILAAAGPARRAARHQPLARAGGARAGSAPQPSRPARRLRRQDRHRRRRLGRHRHGARARRADRRRTRSPRRSSSGSSTTRSRRSTPARPPRRPRTIVELLRGRSRFAAQREGDSAVGGTYAVRSAGRWRGRPAAGARPR